MLPVRHVDDRVVLPLSAVVMAANTLCSLACSRDRTRHDDDCLIPLLEERERLLAADAAKTPRGGLDPDCVIGGAKHLACTGCTCDCHRHRRWCKRCAREIADPTVEETRASGLCLLCLNGPVPGP